MLYMWEEIKQQPKVLESCMEDNRGVQAELIREIRKRHIRSVMIAARGTSDHAGVYGKYVIELLTGLPVSLAAPSVVTMYRGQMKLSDTLVIGISQSGQAGDATEVILSAKKSGALTVGITNFPDSPLAQACDYHLFCDAGLEKSVAATKTFTAQMILIGSLFAKLADNDKLYGEYSGVPEKLGRMLELSDEIREKAERYRFMKECFVLARGINYPIALETALKIQETTYTRAKAFATSDFYHGPMAMIERDMPAIVFAPTGPSLGDVKDMIAKLRDSGADLFVVSDDEAVCGSGSCSCVTPKSASDFTSPFINVTFAQIFACRLALAKNLDPDEPRLLHKVTITR